ncbi:ATP-dependent helicase [Fluviispira multicolorata]|uniref:DNA 3'-5' helicase n=1 Tax=Fluviispira multicolorata TaxID=2654512 RepID=A0A833JF39_9BACT|nr:UvrD-helicase domain-containing protein [Fluviispira multicolorata]KAB8030744.1 AAA family ATPase [Fluviispira multicolorata]
MQHILTQLNNEQREAVISSKGALLVLAGAGTGKTKVITTRIAWMIHSGIRPESIVAVSFTNKAAKEMQERLAILVSEKIARKVELSTFHSFALKILRNYHAEFGLQNKFSISDEGESRNLLRESIREFNLEDILSLQDAAQKISHFKDCLFTDDDFTNKKNIFDSKILKQLFNAYNRRLRLYNLIDFDDIVYLTVLGFKNNPSLLEKIQNNISFLMVDEFQDTSHAQFEFICMLSSKSRNICVVGDDDQSIYSWRGAKPSVISDFLNKFPEAKKVTLEQNYRCSPNILNAANSVIRENTERLGKELWSKQENIHSVIIHECENERDESIFVADNICYLQKNNHSFNYDDVAVLVRSNSQTLSLEQVFAEKKIPYHINGGTQFFDRKEVRDLFSYLKLAHNNSDLNSLFRIMNLPSRGIGITTLEKIKETYFNAYKQNSKISIIESLTDLAKTHKGILEFINLWNIFGTKLRHSENIVDISSALKECYENIGLKKDILVSSANMQIAQFRMEIVGRVLKVIEKLELEKENIQSVIDALHLDEAKFDRANDNSGKVQIMTIHASKGLEFPNVFLIGVEEGILPHERSLTIKNGEQEERRLFYVAITRAKYRLLISHCGFRKKGRSSNSEREPKPSRFLTAIPRHLVEYGKTDPSSEEARRMEAARKLFDLFR